MNSSITCKSRNESNNANVSYHLLFLVFLFLSLGCRKYTKEVETDALLRIAILGVSNQSASDFSSNSYSSSTMELRYILKIDNLKTTEIDILQDSLNFMVIFPEGSNAIATRIYAQGRIKRNSQDTLEVFVPFNYRLTEQEYAEVASSPVSIKMTSKEIPSGEIRSHLTSNLRPQRVFHPSTLPSSANDTLRNIY